MTSNHEHGQPYYYPSQNQNQQRYNTRQSNFSTMEIQYFKFLSGQYLK